MLILPIKRHWYDLIRCGEKKEEYREIKPFYRSRFQNAGFLDEDGKPTPNVDYVNFRNGYSKSSPTFSALCRIHIGPGRKEWGAESGKEYYVLEIINKMEVVT